MVFKGICIHFMAAVKIMRVQCTDHPCVNRLSGLHLRIVHVFYAYVLVLLTGQADGRMPAT